LYYLLPQYRFVPFLTVGGGIMDINGSELWGNRTSLLLEYGLGIKYYLSDSLALRADGRNLFSFDNNRHSQLEFTGGISYYFNKAKNAAIKAAAADELYYAAPVQPRPAATPEVKKEIPAEKKQEIAKTVTNAPPTISQPAVPAFSQAPKAAAS